MNCNFISDEVVFGKKIKLSKFINLYGCSIGDNTKIGAFVEIQKGAKIGRNCKISSHSFICEGVEIGDNCFIGHGVMFINDKHPRSTTPDGRMEDEADWMERFVKTIIEDGATIGSNVTILGNLTIGKGALVGAGSVVVRDIPAAEVWVGNPAAFLKKR